MEYFHPIWRCRCESRSDLCRSLKVKWKCVFCFFNRLTESHKKAIRVIQRMRYFVAKRNFQVVSTCLHICISISCMETLAVRREEDLMLTLGVKGHVLNVTCHVRGMVPPTGSGWVGIPTSWCSFHLPNCAAELAVAAFANIVSKTERSPIHFIMLKWNKLDNPLRGFLHFSH